MRQVSGWWVVGSELVLMVSYSYFAAHCQQPTNPKTGNLLPTNHTLPTTNHQPLKALLDGFEHLRGVFAAEEIFAAAFESDEHAVGRFAVLCEIPA